MNAETTARPLAGHGALVTGGAGNFGRTIALRLLEDGAAVTLLDRSQDDLDDAATELHAAVPGASVRTVAGDACDEQVVARAVAEADQDMLRIVACTVGGGTITPLLALSTEDFEADFRLNTVSALHALKHAVPRLVAHGGGSIVCISSSAAGHSMPYLASYSVAKAALESLVRNAADELGHLRVRVNGVRPGYVPARGAESRPEDAVRAEAVRRTKPLAKPGTADDIARAVRYLAGPDSPWVTGVCLPVEGGSHLRGAVDQESVARMVCGDDVVDRALKGELVTP